jgi:hypothetical protein
MKHIMEHIMGHGVGKNISSPIFLRGDFPMEIGKNERKY